MPQYKKKPDVLCYLQSLTIFLLNPFRKCFCLSKKFHVFFFFFFSKGYPVKNPFSTSSLGRYLALLLCRDLTGLEDTPSLVSLHVTATRHVPLGVQVGPLSCPQLPGSLPFSLVHSCQHPQCLRHPTGHTDADRTWGLSKAQVFPGGSPISVGMKPALAPG